MTEPPASIRKQIETDAEAQIATLNASINTLAAIAASGTANATYIRSLAKEIKGCVEQTLRLTRLVVDAFDTADAAPAQLPAVPME